jgi:hypothetical protein
VYSTITTASAPGGIAPPVGIDTALPAAGDRAETADGSAAHGVHQLADVGVDLGPTAAAGQQAGEHLVRLG